MLNSYQSSSQSNGKSLYPVRPALSQQKLTAGVESQPLRTSDVVAQRQRALGRLTGAGSHNDAHVDPMVRALRDSSYGPLTLTLALGAKAPTGGLSFAVLGETARRLIGQPASPRAATGAVGGIHGRGELGKLQQGEVRVCDAIQPAMTHPVPLASASVKRRGGMLIHRAIGARELGISHRCCIRVVWPRPGQPSCSQVSSQLRKRRRPTSVQEKRLTGRICTVIVHGRFLVKRSRTSETGLQGLFRSCRPTGCGGPGTKPGSGDHLFSRGLSLSIRR